MLSGVQLNGFNSCVDRFLLQFREPRISLGQSFEISLGQSFEGGRELRIELNRLFQAFLGSFRSVLSKRPCCNKKIP